MFVEQVVELKQRHGIRGVLHGDSLMNPYLIPFANALMKQNADILYDGYLRADRPVTNKKFVGAWAASGLYRVRLGVESASVNVLKSMDKKTSPEVISEVLKTLAAPESAQPRIGLLVSLAKRNRTSRTRAILSGTITEIFMNWRRHPYYYYPYGQVGSRLYQCESVYPDEVTNLTKFKVWEIIGANPPRKCAISGWTGSQPWQRVWEFRTSIR